MKYITVPGQWIKKPVLIVAKTNTSAHWGILEVKAGFLWGQWRALHAWVCACRGKSEHQKRILVSPCTFLKEVRSCLKPSPLPPSSCPVQIFPPSATPQSMREDFYTWNDYRNPRIYERVHMQVNSSKSLYNLLQECKQHKQNLMSSLKIGPASRP